MEGQIRRDEDDRSIRSVFIHPSLLKGLFMERVGGGRGGEGGSGQSQLSIQRLTSGQLTLAAWFWTVEGNQLLLNNRVEPANQ